MVNKTKTKLLDLKKKLFLKPILFDLAISYLDIYNQDCSLIFGQMILDRFLKGS